MTHVDYTMSCLRTRGQTESDTGRPITVWEFSLHVDRQRLTQVNRLQYGISPYTWIDRE